MTKEKFLGTTPITKIKFDKFCEEYMEKYAKVNKRSWSRDQISIAHLNGFFDDKTLNEIATRDVENYKAHRQTFVGNSTINREMACLKCMFNLAVKWGYAKDNPVRGVSFFKENNQRVRFLEPQERKRLLAFCPPHLKPIVIMALNTGLRKSEILNLTWSDIDFERRLIHVRQSKSGESRYIPMNNFLTETLQDVTKRLDSPYIFCDESGKPYKSVKKSFNNALKKAGIKDFVFHDLRHCYGSYLTMAGVDITTVKELMGHKTITMTLRYSHLSPSHKQAAVDKLQNYMDGGMDDSREEVATYKQHGKLGQAAV
jgi:integrase